MLTKEAVEQELQLAIEEFESAQEALRLATDRWNKAFRLRDQALRANGAFAPK